jgi:8-oxo-dGTP pyrophosphatase MutT (NUDIX family)
VTLHAAAVRTLRTWRAPSPEQEVLRAGYLEHLAAHPDGMWKAGPPAHLTASLMVLDPDRRRVLLTLHRKGRFWVQLGGHCEIGDTGLEATALREGREESGIADLHLLPGPVDLDRHVLATAFGRCREHLDVAYAAIAAADAAPVVSDESDDVAWWPLDGLPPDIVPDLPRRLRDAAALLGPPAQARSSGRSRAAESPSR